MLRIALPNKGRLADEARELFTDAGLEIRAAGPARPHRLARRRVPGDLRSRAGHPGVRRRRRRGRRGDRVRSRARVGARARRAGRSQFGRCRLAVAATEESGRLALDDLAGGHASGHGLSARHAQNSSRTRGRRVEIVPVSGAAEIAPHIGIADVIVDLVSTGSTLRVNGLREIATVLESSARLVAAPAYAQRTWLARARWTSWWRRSRSVLAARDKRYVMANVPRDRLDEVKRGASRVSTARRSSTS